MNLAIHLLTSTVFSVVTGRGYNNDSAVHESTDRNAHRIVLVRVDRRHADAEIYYADVVRRSIGHQPVKSAEDVRNRAGAVGVQNAQVENFGSRSDADVFAFRDDAVAGGCGCYVSSVTVWIVGSAFTGEILVNNNSG